MDYLAQPNPQPEELGMIPSTKFNPRTHEPITPRIKDPRQLRAIFDQCFDNDIDRRVERSQVQAMAANKQPFSPKKMRDAGLEGCSNIDFRLGSTAIRRELAPYANNVINTKTFMRIATRAGADAEERKYNSDKLSEGHTRMLRAWPEFLFRYLYAAQYTMAHGKAFAYFDNASDWRWFVAQPGELLVPELTKSDAEDFGFAVSQREYQVHELYQQIQGFTKEDYDLCKVKDEHGEWGRYKGWHLPSVISAMEHSGEKEFFTANDFDLAERLWEANEVYYSRSEKVVLCVVGWCTEGDGKISQYTASKNPQGATEPQDEIFLYKKLAKFPSMSNAVILFRDSIGYNGYIHSIHGRGSAMFPIVRRLTEMKNRFTDAIDVEISIPISGTEEAITSELAYTRAGVFLIIHQGIKLLERSNPNYSKNAIPALEMLERDLLGVLPRPKEEQSNDIEQMFASFQSVDPLSAALWYHSFDRLLKESLRRCKNYESDMESGAEFVWEWKRWMIKEGVDESKIDEIFRKIDIDDSYAVMPIGNGNPAATFACFDRMEKFVPFMDEKGKNNWARAGIAALPGMNWSHVDDFVPQVPGSRPGVETKVAMLENKDLLRGEEVEVLDDEPHLLHLSIHSKEMEDKMKQVEEGTLSRMEASTQLFQMYLHAEKHIEFAGDNPILKKEVNEYKRAIEVLGEIIVNGQRELQKKQKEQGQMQAQGQEPTEKLPNGLTPHQFEAVEKAKIRLQEAQQNWAIKAAEAKMNLELKRQDAAQKRSHRDAEQAAKLASKYLQPE